MNDDQFEDLAKVGEKIRQHPPKVPLQFPNSGLMRAAFASVTLTPSTNIALAQRVLNSLRRSENERVDRKRAVSKVRKQGQPAKAR